VEKDQERRRGYRRERSMSRGERCRKVLVKEQEQGQDWGTGRELLSVEVIGLVLYQLVQLLQAAIS
jgi:hypothetical protein